MSPNAGSATCVTTDSIGLFVDTRRNVVLPQRRDRYVGNVVPARSNIIAIVGFAPGAKAVLTNPCGVIVI